MMKMISAEVAAQKYENNRRTIRLRSNYSVELWHEAKRRWMVGGVLVAVLVAVLAPRLGAPGGKHCMLTRPLGAQYLRWVPLSYIYYSAGRRARRAALARTRLLAVSCAHAALLAPALAVLLMLMHGHAHGTPLDASAGTRAALLRGVVMSSVGGGCSWLSLAVCEDEAAPLVTALNYAVSLVATPLAMLLLCGRATVPPLGAIAATLACAAPAFLAGVAHGAVRAGDGAGGAGRGCALLLVWAQCCVGLGARGAVRLADLLAVLLLELSWLGMSAGLCWAYARCGLLSAADASVVAACAVPKTPDEEWQPYAVCVPLALSRLPGVFLPPAQALLLAALPSRLRVHTPPLPLHLPR